VYCCCQCALLSTYQTYLLVFLIYHKLNCRTKFLSFGNICMLQVLCIYNTKLQSSITLMRNVRVVKMQTDCVCVCVCEEIHTWTFLCVYALVLLCSLPGLRACSHWTLVLKWCQPQVILLPTYLQVLTYLPTYLEVLSFTRLSTPQ
jgi:hypothetical protein